MTLFIFRLATLTYTAFMLFELIRPGFVSYYLNPLWLLVPVIVALVVALAQRKREPAPFLFIDRMCLSGIVVLALLSQRELLSNGQIILWSVLVVLASALLPLLLESTYSTEYDNS